MNADKAARHGEGVDRRIVDRKKIEADPGIAADRNQATAELIEISLDIRIIQIGRLAPANLIHDLLADLLFGRQRQFFAGHITQFRQVFGTQGLRRQGAGQYSSEETSGKLHDAMIPQAIAAPGVLVVTKRNKS